MTVTDRTAGHFRPDIEGLRAVAVLAVVAFHANVPGFSGGFVGVDVFFVISGFLITSQLRRDQGAGRGIRLREFYARRVRRLLPAATATIVVTLAGAWVLQSAVLQRTTALDALGAALFYSNVRFTAQAADYFQQTSAPSLFQHFWSLSIEEQFYLVWPALLMVASVGGTTRRKTRGVAAACLAVLVVSFAAAMVLTDSDPELAYFSLATRAWELAVGAFLAVGASRVTMLSHRWRAPMAGGGLVLIAVAIAGFDGDTAFPGPWALVPVAGSAAVIASGIGATSGIVGTGLSLAPMQLGGRYSYSLYLWHWPALTLAAMRYDTVLTSWPKALFIVAVVAVPLAVSSFHLLEAPVRRSPWWRLTRHALLGGAALLATSALAVGAFAALTPGQIDAGRDAPRLTEAILTARKATEFVPANLRPSLRDAESDARSDAPWSCPDRTECSYGDLDSDTTIMVFGDSHAAHFGAAFHRVGMDRRVRIVGLSAGGCGSFLSEPIGTTTRDCPGWRNHAFARIEALRPALVVLSNHSAPTFRNDRADWERGIERTLRRLGNARQVLVIGESPDAREEVPACLAEHVNDTAACEPAWPNPSTARLNAELADLVEASGAAFVDPTAWLCDDERCPVVMGDVLVYHDKNHFTREFAQALRVRVGAVVGPLLAPE